MPCLGSDAGRRRVVIVGGGFGGLTAAQALRRAPVDVVLIDRANHHLFQPLLYQVATAALSPTDIAAPLRAVLRTQPNATVIMDEVRAVDRRRRCVTTAEQALPYDVLILAPGTRHSYFGHPAWETHAPGLKTITDALTIRERILTSFERAAVMGDAVAAAPYLTFVVVGGGPTGVEVAGALAEIAMKGILPDFRSIRPEQVRIILVEGGDRVIAGFEPALSARAQRMLEEMGVEVRLKAPVTEVSANGVTAAGELIESRNVVWAPGNVAPEWLRTLETPVGRNGHVRVGPDLSVPEDPWVFVIGDAAEGTGPDGRPYPALAPLAMQQARYVARLIGDAVPAERRAPFRYRDRGMLSTIGKARAVAQIGPIRTAGLFAWLLWSFVHIFFLIGFRNRARVMLEWIWYYATYRPGARIIYRRIDG